VTSASAHAPSASDARSFPSTATHAPPEPADTPVSYDFLPAVNFDDFANSLAYEPTLSDFPVPASFSTAQPASTGASPAASTTTMHAFTATPTESRPARSNSFMQRFTQSGSRKAGPPPPIGPPPPPPDASAAAQPTTNMAIRTRRQSQFPAQVPSNTAARGPRKSLAPGLVPTGIFENRSEVPRLTPDNTVTRPDRSASLSKGGRRDTSAASQTTAAAVPRLPNATRATKARSFHPSSRQTSGQHLSANATTPDPTSVPLHQSRSPAKSPAAQNDFTPTSSANKRQSTVPHHFGLGARTISPTDARRLRRLSTNPNPAGGPVGPPTPLADFPFDEQVFTQSPAISIRKSETPSSARATPELTRKSYASGISISSNSSINSLKAAGSSIPMRTNPTLASSRLPTPKTRNVHSSAAGEEEDVPPVPAIPKAFESPKDPDRTSFTFSMPAAKTNTPSSQEPSSTAGANSSDARNAAGYGDSDSSKTDAMSQSAGSIRHRRGLTVGASAEAPRTPTVQPSGKKNLQPIRLPPLNLLPLGTPFNNRLSSFPAHSDALDKGTVTPPPKRNTKTPSTPMTASKTSFFSTSGHHTQHDYFGKHIRSSSSAVNLRGTETTHPGISSMPIPTLNPGRQATTPFSSNSLPKGSGEFTRLQPRASNEYQSSDVDVELQNMKAVEPRPLKKSNTSDSVQTSNSTDPDTPSTGNSLRRKLSLSGWRRNGSKANAQAAQNQQPKKPGQKSDESAPQPPKHIDMPPPRLPTSSTWSSAPDASPTPTAGTSRLRPSLDFGRRKPVVATTGNDATAEKSKDATNTGTRAASGANLQATSQPITKSGSSLLNPMQRMLGTKASSTVLRSRNLDPNLDRDDMLADEEMKKLASKRKDFEHAARDVDELRKRAKPQERVTPAQALQMVNLNIFERGEIIDYKEVYFCGTKSAKKHVGDLNAQTANFGYDDDRGDYNIVFGDHLAYRYEVVDLLGKGSFGQVVRCVDHKTGGLVAIKIIRNKKRFHQQALVEVNILQKLREWVSTYGI
jgi:dual specificity tyrosine-phosphorylation-regulated kinase 2/3/4